MSIKLLVGTEDEHVLVWLQGHLMKFMWFLSIHEKRACKEA